MAFGAEELRVLRRALALALHPAPASAEDIKDCHRLAESLDEAVREGARLRAFLVADLGRYREALPGTAAGYLALLEEALGAGYRPGPDDLAALRALRGSPAAAALLSRCQVLAERDVRARLAGATAARRAQAAPVVPASRTRLLALPGGLSGGGSGVHSRDGSGVHSRDGSGGLPGAPAGVVRAGLAEQDAKEPRREPGKDPAKPPVKPAEKPAPAAPKPSRPIPTPGEVFPRRKPTPPSANPPQQLAAG
ncbi:hypothetical protein [Streptomyces griseorubiginosus]|uniref:Uncharacterized protein n=1 Tax=Streptomyces griseorubiginosus TaxID=67304 RepID=A0AAI8L1X2_9ACTN|nr:hypothetical protein [Streptomyces griseorubiginosus]AYC39518.1 hypothetical protein DWG14_03758 [Streptomyces griseorubiginosus]